MVDFSLGAAGGRNQPHQEAEEANEGIHTESLFLYGGGSVRGFELWQHQQQQIHPQQHPHQLLCQASTATLLAFGASDEPIVMNPARTGSTGGGGGMNCQDCGNQAKKDCVHMRCRTCCKSRGFHCLTHVKSTWVPAATRRERQQQLAAVLQQSPARHRAAAGESTKRPRDPSARLPTIITAPASVGTEGVLSFPAEVTSPAVFRCVRVSPMEVAVDHFAYQTSVSIGGHVFKGILYDQGPESLPECRIHHGGETSSTATPSGNRSMGTGAALSAAVLLNADSASLYPTPLSAFIAGTQRFPPPREALTQPPAESQR